MKQKNTGLPTPSSSTPAWLAALSVALFAFLLYANTMSNGFVLDDAGVVTNNLFVLKGFRGIPEILKAEIWHFDNVNLGYYRPLSLITFATEIQLFGKNPAVFHFGNVLLFSLTCFFLFLLLKKLLHSSHPLFPLMITLLFAAHPIHTEVVANIKSRDEILSFLNLILTLYLMFVYDEKRKPIYLILSLIFFYLALLSKETSTIGVVLVPLMLYVWGKEDLRKMIPQMVAFVGTALLFFVQKKMVLGSLSGTIPDDIVNYPYMGAGLRVATACLFFLYSIKLFLWPLGLKYDYSYNAIPAGDWSDPLIIAGFLGLIAISVYGIRNMYLKEKGEAFSSMPTFLTAFFLITLAPLMAFVILRGGIFAERFLYAPSLSFCAALVFVCSYFLKADFSKSSESMKHVFIKNKSFSFVMMAIILCYSGLAFSRNRDWKDNYTLFSTDILNNANSAQNHRHFGSECINQAMVEKDSIRKHQLFDLGISNLKEAIRIHPRFGDAFFKIGVAYQSVYPNADSLIYYYNKAIDTAPGFAISYNNLGIYYQGQKNYEMASYFYNKAIEMNPNFPDAKRNSASLKAATGLDVHLMPVSVNLDSMRTHTSNKDDKYYYNMGTFYASKGDYRQAMENLILCIKMNPKYEDAYINLGNCYGVQGMFKEAVDVTLQVLSLNPNNQRALQNLSVSYHNMGEEKKAEEAQARLRQIKN